MIKFSLLDDIYNAALDQVLRNIDARIAADRQANLSTAPLESLKADLFFLIRTPPTPAPIRPKLNTILRDIRTFLGVLRREKGSAEPAEEACDTESRG